MNSTEIIKKEVVLGNEFTVYGDFETPLFLATDVAKWIGYSIRNASKMILSVDEDERVLRTISTTGKSDAWFLTENGVYEVLMQSRKPLAKQFKKEVKRILREIRLTGGYTVPKNYAEALEVAAAQAKKVAEQKALIDSQKPMVEGYNEYIDMGRFCNFRDAANYLRVTQTELMDLLRTKYIYKNEAGEYRCYAEYMPYFELRPYKRSVKCIDKATGETYTARRTGNQLMVTLAGLHHLGTVIEERKGKIQQETWQRGKDAADMLIKSMSACCPVFDF